MGVASAMSDRRKIRDPLSNPALCGHYDDHRNNRGELCGANVISGTRACGRHSGKPRKQAKAEGAVVAELRAWRLGDVTEDPGVVLLRLVTQSAARVARLGAELERVVEQCGGDLRKALTGEVWVTGDDGGSHKSGEYIRALTVLEGQERDRCANFSKIAIVAGLAERQVRLAERQGAVVFGIIAGALRALGHDPADPAVRALISAEIARQTGVGSAIEGVAS
jgi:hypothetical protein